MLVRYLPVLLVLTALVLALAPLEAAGQTSSGAGASVSDAARAQAARKPDKPRPKTGGAPVNANADKAPLPPGSDVRQVRPAEAFPPERIAPSDIQTPQAPSRGGVRKPDAVDAPPSAKDDPRSVEERADPGG